MKKLIKKLKWRYTMWRMQTFIAYGVDDGVVTVSVSKTGFFKPLYRRKTFRVDTKKQGTRCNASPAPDQNSPEKASPL